MEVAGPRSSRPDADGETLQLRDVLEELVLDHNCFTDVPAHLDHLPKLKALELGANPIKVLTPRIGDLRSLQKLSIYNTLLSIIPPQIGKLANLKELWLFANRDLATLPVEALQRLTKLQKLAVSTSPRLSSIAELKKTLPKLSIDL